MSSLLPFPELMATYAKRMRKKSRSWHAIWAPDGNANISVSLGQDDSHVRAAHAVLRYNPSAQPNQNGTLFLIYCPQKNNPPRRKKPRT